MTIAVNVTTPGAIPDYATLISTVQSWLDRDDLANQVPVFIQMAEAMFNREIRASQMESTVTGSASAEDTSLPDDYLAMRAIYIEGSPDKPLRGMSPAAAREEFDGTSGTPVAYCLVSGCVRLIPPPQTPILLKMDYWALIQGLSVFAPSNWVLAQHPDVYLYATLFHAEAYLDNATRAAQWKSLTDGIIQRINRTNISDRFGAGPLVPNTAVQVRNGIC